MQNSLDPSPTSPKRRISVACTSVALQLLSGASGQECPSFSQLTISNCNYGCFPVCESASQGDLLGAVNGCFHDAWGFGEFGLFGDVEVGLWVCDNPCGCNNETPEQNCLGCRQLSFTRLNGEPCTGTFGCLELLGPENRCCPAVMRAGGYECLLAYSGNCGSAEPESYGALAPLVCGNDCRWNDGCDRGVSNNTRCSLTQTSSGRTGLFPDGCSASTRCIDNTDATTPPTPAPTSKQQDSKVPSAAPQGSEGPTTSPQGSTDTAPQSNPEGPDLSQGSGDPAPQASPDEPDPDRPKTATTSKTAPLLAAVVTAISALVSAFMFLLRRHRKVTLLRMCTTRELMGVQLSSVTSPFSGLRTPEMSEKKARPTDTSATAKTSGSTSSSPLSVHLSRVTTGEATIPSGLRWVHDDFLRPYPDAELAAPNENDPAEAPTGKPGQIVFVTDDNMTQISALSLSETVRERQSVAHGSGVAASGDVLCNFRRSNARATRSLMELALSLSETAGIPMPGWTGLFGIPDRAGEPGVQSATLVLPERDSMVGQFEFDGQDRMTWRALKGDGNGCVGDVSIACVVCPSVRWWVPRLRGRIAQWNDEELVDDTLVSFDLTVRRLAKRRFRVEDRMGNISGTADAPSGGVALLAVLLCSLEGGCGTDKQFSKLNWTGGRHSNGLITLR